MSWRKHGLKTVDALPKSSKPILRLLPPNKRSTWNNVILNCSTWDTNLLKMKNLSLYPTTEKITTPDYPYGYKLRCTKYDWIEFKPGFGFRHVYQTTNPKDNDKLNKPKAGQYYPCMLLGTNPENGYLESSVLTFYGFEGALRDCKSVLNVQDKFTDKQWEFIADKVASTLYGTYRYTSEAEERIVAAELLKVYLKVTDEKTLSPLEFIIEVSNAKND